MGSSIGTVRTGHGTTRLYTQNQYYVRTLKNSDDVGIDWRLPNYGTTVSIVSSVQYGSTCTDIIRNIILLLIMRMIPVRTVHWNSSSATYFIQVSTYIRTYK